MKKKFKFFFSNFFLIFGFKFFRFASFHWTLPRTEPKKAKTNQNHQKTHFSHISTVHSTLKHLIEPFTYDFPLKTPKPQKEGIFGTFSAIYCQPINGIPFEEFDLEDQKRTSVREVDLSEYELDHEVNSAKARGVPDKIVEVDGMDSVDEYASLENIVLMRENSCAKAKKQKNKVEKSVLQNKNFYGKAVSKIRVQESRKCGESVGTIKTTTGDVTVCQNDSSVTAYGIKYGNFVKRFEPAQKVEVSEQMENSPACPSCKG